MLAGPLDPVDALLSTGVPLDYDIAPFRTDDAPQRSRGQGPPPLGIGAQWGRLEGETRGASSEGTEKDRPSDVPRARARIAR
jgi:hypothetical protein